MQITFGRKNGGYVDLESLGFILNAAGLDADAVLRAAFETSKDQAQLAQSKNEEATQADETAVATRRQGIDAVEAQFATDQRHVASLREEAQAARNHSLCIGRALARLGLLKP